MFLTRNLAYIILYYNIYYTYIIIIKSGVVKKSGFNESSIKVDTNFDKNLRLIFLVIAETKNSESVILTSLIVLMLETSFISSIIILRILPLKLNRWLFFL